MNRNIDVKLQRKMEAVGWTYYDGFIKDFLLCKYLEEPDRYFEVSLHKSDKMSDAVAKRLATFNLDKEAITLRESISSDFPLKQAIEKSEWVKERLEQLYNLLNENKL